MSAATDWIKAENADDVEDNAIYLVLTNGGEWGDVDAFIWPGAAVRNRLKPDFVRGRPTWIAKINLPQ